MSANQARGKAAVIAAIALVAAIGAVTTLQGSAAAAGPGPVTLPDMRIFVPTNLISIGIDPGTGHRDLRFTHKTADVGPGPFEIDPHYDARSGISTFTQRIYRMPQAGDWVPYRSVPLGAVGTWEPPSDYRFPLTRFTLNTVLPGGGVGKTVAVSPKVDYCITGDTEVGGVPNTPSQTAIPVGDCTDPTPPLGWSVGWADEYDETDAGQPIDLSGIPDGTYVLRATVDPDHVLRESSTANDVTDTRLKLAGDQVTVLSQQVVNVPLPRVTLARLPARISAWGSLTLHARVAPPPGAQVSSVQFLLGGQPLGHAVRRSPYAAPWTVRGTTPGIYYLSARVTDGDGVTATARPVPVKVRPAPSLSVRSLHWQKGMLTLRFSGVPRRDTVKAVISSRSSRSPVTVHNSHLRIRCARPKWVRLEVFDSRQRNVGSVLLRLNARPAIRIVNPTPSQTVFGITPVSAQASDSVGVTSVKFFLDGHALGRTLHSPPYAMPWDTRHQPGGRHILSARVVNALGHSASSRVAVIVHNPSPPMTCFVLQKHVHAHGTGAVSVPPFHTVVAGETLLAFVSADGPQTSRQSATVSGGGLHWKLVSRANSSPGDAEVWQAIASRPTAVKRVTATLSRRGYGLSLSVIAMEGGDGTGATASASGATGAPTVRLRTESSTSLVFAVGHDWDSATARQLPVGWVMLDQWLDGSAGDTYWSQYTNQPTGAARTLVTVTDRAPTHDDWDLAAVELINDGG
jgi:hypothetical protein